MRFSEIGLEQRFNNHDNDIRLHFGVSTNIESSLSTVFGKDLSSEALGFETLTIFKTVIPALNQTNHPLKYKDGKIPGH